MTCPRRGRPPAGIPSEGRPVGQALQVLARLYWATGDDAYHVAAEPIARADLELDLSRTGWIPPRTWDFPGEGSTTSAAQFRDHSNEVVAGLVEFHLLEAALGLPEGPKLARVRLLGSPPGTSAPHDYVRVVTAAPLRVQTTSQDGRSRGQLWRALDAALPFVSGR